MHLKNILYTRTLYISDLEGRYKKDTVTIFALYRFPFTRVHTKVVVVQCTQTQGCKVRRCPYSSKAHSYM